MQACFMLPNLIWRDNCEQLLKPKSGKHSYLYQCVWCNKNILPSYLRQLHTIVEETQLYAIRKRLEHKISSLHFIWCSSLCDIQQSFVVQRNEKKGEMEKHTTKTFCGSQLGVEAHLIKSVVDNYNKKQEDGTVLHSGEHGLPRWSLYHLREAWIGANPYWRLYQYLSQGRSQRG